MPHIWLDCSPTTRKTEFLIIPKGYIAQSSGIVYSIERHLLYNPDSRVLIPNSAGKKDFCNKSLITQVRDIVESCILVSGVERTFLYRLILESLKNKWQIFSENSYNSIRVNFSWILLWFLFCRSTYFFFLILPFACKMATDLRKSSISWPKWPSIKIKNILFDSSWDDVSTHMCFKIIQYEFIYLFIF